MTYIGVDAHSSFLVATTLQDDKKSRVRVDLENLEFWAAGLDPDAEVVLEASTNAFHIHDVLLPYVKRVAVAHPLYLRWIAESRMKTDKLDSEKLAMLLKADLIPEVWVPSPAQRELRAAVHRREKLIAARTREVNGIYATYRRAGVPMKKGEVLKQASSNDSRLSHPSRVAVASALRHIAYLNEEITALEGDLLLQAKDVIPAWQLEALMGIPGIDAVSAITIMAEIGDIERFPQAANLYSYAGITPRIHASGNTLRMGSISKQGRTLLRTVLVRVSWKTLAFSPLLAAKYGRVVAKRGDNKTGHKIAIVAVARTLLGLIWGLLHLKQPIPGGVREPKVRTLPVKLRQMERRAREYSFLASAAAEEPRATETG